MTIWRNTLENNRDLLLWSLSGRMPVWGLHFHGKAWSIQGYVDLLFHDFCK
jgi:hypothetical protein